MRDYRSLNHTRWDRKYHVVFIPKRRRKKIYGVLRKHLGEVFHELARQKRCRIEGGSFAF
jgi:putative transposase